jgi:hypothetical protein
MGKIRTVKPELFRHEELFEAEKIHRLPLRLAFIGLFTCCDREGRFRWRPKQLKLDMLPYDDIDMADILNALVEHSFIVQYEVNGERYGYIPSWNKHQCINVRESASVLPGVEMGLVVLHGDDETISLRTCMHVQQHTQVSNSNFASTPVVTDTPTPENASAKIKTITENHFETAQSPRPIQPNALTNDEKPLEIQIEIDDKTSIETEHFDNCPALVSEIAHACTCMHMGKWKGTGSGKGTGNGTGMGSGTGREREKEGRLGANRNFVAPARRRPDFSADIHSIFDFWKTTFQHPQAVLDPKRQKLIHQALQQGYTVGQLCDAISGCSQTPHNMGDNDRGQRYDGLHVILRDSDQIERFIHHHHNPPRPPNPNDKLLQANIDAGKNWLNRKNRTGEKS